MKKYGYLLLLGIACLCNTSCTVLQWRKTDEAIQQKFKTENINSEITYYKVDSLNLDIRIHEVKSQDNTVNLIFFHGSPSSLSAWENYMLDSKLLASANMYAIDRPGYGYSNFGKQLTSISTQAQIMSAVINKKVLDNVIVIGSSYGVPLAARIAYLNKNVKALVMVSPAIDPENEKDIWASRFTQWKLTRWLVPTAYRVAGDEKTVHAKELEIIAKDWKKLQIPVLHFHGDVDDIVPFENIHFSKENFNNIKVISVEGKGHEIAWKNPEIIMPYLVNLIEDIQTKK
ncbi:alpha/beta hydrolase [Lacinutrix sp. MedPE-SW]|uniref:alpha/beta fold hydrolase n=1 Tax=Lacinutrix sp. MedPE-SW TaxID=1860087 RepID=UPI00091E8144|nr:alpha/beta hydrolase [Lacinutrix sp. MedPE-SW]OIQ22750.1 MAG: alpha/beta hydrolase [Lacinutrix sp. MedPE-SW]